MRRKKLHMMERYPHEKKIFNVATTKNILVTPIVDAPNWI